MMIRVDTRLGCIRFGLEPERVESLNWVVLTNTK